MMIQKSILLLPQRQNLTTKTKLSEHSEYLEILQKENRLKKNL